MNIISINIYYKYIYEYTYINISLHVTILYIYPYFCMFFFFRGMGDCLHSGFIMPILESRLGHQIGKLMLKNSQPTGVLGNKPFWKMRHGCWTKNRGDLPPKMDGL